MTHLLIAGHGKKKDGTFDPGATGLIAKGEHRYVKEDLFPAMKKYLPKDADVVFFSDYKVLDYGNIVALANSYGKDTKVTEIHFDAGSAAASGGHVIVYKGFEPDALDLRLRDAIKKSVGVRYTHKGHEGISGRGDELGEVRMTRKANVNFRLVELGFGTNKKDADFMTNHVDEYAKNLVEALLNETIKQGVKPAEKPKPADKPAAPKKSIEQMASEVIAGKHGNGHENRRKSLGISQAEYDKVKDRVNGVKPTAPKKSIEQMAKEVIAGKHGNGHETRRKSLGISQAEYNKVRDRVNNAKPPGKSINQMAKEVIAGKHGNGHETRRKSLGISKSEYEKVRQAVNKGV